MRDEAQRVRLEAQRMEEGLTHHKIARLQAKLEDPGWLAKHSQDAPDLERQLHVLQGKLVASPLTATTGRATTTVSSSSSSSHTSATVPPPTVVETTTMATTNDSTSAPPLTMSSSTTKVASPTTTISTMDEDTAKRLEENPIAGFDQADLDVYLPVAYQLEAQMSPNATIDERLTAFRGAPTLQEHFATKIKGLLMQPMEDMQKLEDLRSEFLHSRSRVEKENVRRQIQQMEKSLEEEGPFGYSDSIFANVAPMPANEMEERLLAIGALPSVLQALYLKRTNAPEDDLALAIELEHYEAQIQLLEQIKLVDPWTSADHDEAVQAIESLPISIRNHLATKPGLESGGEDTEKLLQVLLQGQKNGAVVQEWSNLQELVVASGASGEECDDLDYIDRSRYAEEFYPSIARMEGQHPSLEDMDLFLSEVIDKRAFMVRSKPERVVGGWYVRGDNLLSEDENGVECVKRLVERLQAQSDLAPRLEFFYIPDPSPLSDEDFEMDIRTETLLYVTGKNPKAFYNNAEALTKISVSTLGLCSIALFSLATVEMVPYLQERLDTALAVSGTEDLGWMTSIVTPVFLSMLGILSAHEVGHAAVAWRDKFKIGFGGPVPSIQTGCLGAITPLESPPPSLKSMFDFAIAGPLMGLLASLVFLVVGLQETATMDLNTALDFPGLPMFLLRSSALGGGLIEFFLGKGTLLPGVNLPVEAVLPIHPFAISGFCGLMVNALALLPLGSK
jgi:hypothetical protein